MTVTMITLYLKILRKLQHFEGIRNTSISFSYVLRTS